MGNPEQMTPDEDIQAAEAKEEGRPSENSPGDIIPPETEEGFVRTAESEGGEENDHGPMAEQLKDLQEKMKVDAASVVVHAEGLAEELGEDAKLEKLSGQNKETWEVVMHAAEAGKWDVVKKTLPALTATSLDNELLLAMTGRLRSVAEQQGNVPQTKRFARAEAADLRELGRLKERKKLLEKHFNNDEIASIDEANKLADARDRDISNEKRRKRERAVKDAKEEIRQQSTEEEPVAEVSIEDAPDTPKGVPAEKQNTSKHEIALRNEAEEQDASKHEIALRNEAEEQDASKHEAGGPGGPEGPRTFDAGEPSDGRGEDEDFSFWDAMKAGSLALFVAGMNKARVRAGRGKGFAGKVGGALGLIALAPLALGGWMVYKMLKWITQRGPELISKYTGAKIPNWVKEANGTAPRAEARQRTKK